MRYRKGFVLSCLMALLSMTFVACSSETSNNLMLHTVQRGAFDDILRVEGFAESVNSQAFTCPHDADGSIKYIVENGTLVKKGDTLWDIARKYGMTVNELKSLNNLSTNMLKIGQTLKIKPTEKEEVEEFDQMNNSLYKSYRNNNGEYKYLIERIIVLYKYCKLWKSII